jgi:hypothetical protein
MAAANYSKEAMDDFINRSMGSPSATTPAPAPTVVEPIKVESRNFADTHRSNIISIQSEIEKNKNNPKNIKILNDELAREQANLSGAQNTEMDKFIEAGMKESTTPAGQQLASEIDKLQPSRFVNIVAPPKSEEQQLAEAQTKGMPINPQIAAQGQRGRALRTEEPPVNAVGQLARALLQNPVVRPLAAVSGVIGGLIHAAKTGESPEPPAEDIRKALVEQYTYVPPGERGRELLQTVASIPEKITGSSMGFPPFTGMGPGTVLAPAVASQVAPTVTKGVVSAAQGIGRAAEGVEQAVKKTGEFVGEVGAARRQMVDQFAQKRAPIVPPVASAAEAPVMKGGGAAVSEMNPYRPFPNEEQSRGGVFSLLKSSKTAEDLKLPNQQQAVNIVQEVLGPESDVRPGVVTQNINTLKNEYTEANLAKPTPRSDLLKRQIANEQTALSEYAKNRIAQTGADTNLVDPYARGERINNAFAGGYNKTSGEFEGLTGFLQKEKSALYDEAKRTVGTNPIESSTIEKLLNNPQFNSTAKASGVNLEGFKELLQQHKTTGFENAAANSINSMEEFRKSINKTWSPDRKYFIGKMVNSIDEDIAKAGGPGLLQQARNLHQAEKTLFASKGIKTMFGEIDPNGVQLATKFEDIPKKLNSLGADEWKHIYDTADQLSKGRVRGVGFDIEVPPEIRQAAQSAKNEMRGSIAREIYEAGSNKLGVWNQNAANKIMNARWQKIKYAFDPEEVKKLHTLNYAGQLMPGVHAYEGAALQGQRVQGIIESNLGKLGATVGGSAGGFLAGPPGAAAGAYMGGQLGLKSAAAMEAKALQKSAETLQKEMKRNAQLGKNNIKDIGK